MMASSHQIFRPPAMHMPARLVRLGVGQRILVYIVASSEGVRPTDSLVLSAGGKQLDETGMLWLSGDFGTFKRGGPWRALVSHSFFFSSSLFVILSPNHQPIRIHSACQPCNPS